MRSEPRDLRAACRRGVRSACLAVPLTMLGACLASTFVVADENGEAAPYFRKVTVDDLAASDLSSYVIERTVEGQPAEQAGIVPGDVVLAMDGWRVYSFVEAVYVKRYLLSREPRLTLIVKRNGRPLEFDVDELPPDLAMGVFAAKESYAWVVLAGKLGLELKPEQRYVLAFTPARMALLGLQWLEEEPRRLEQSEWLKQFVNLRLTLAEQDWAGAHPIGKEIPLEEFRRVADFWIEVARRNEKGEQPPDPQAHAVDLDFYCFNYPTPRHVPPPLGQFATKDKRWLEWVQDHARDPSLHPEGENLVDLFASTNAESDPFDDYLRRVKLSVVHPTDHAGWPYWYQGAEYDVIGGYLKVLRELYRRVEDDPGDRALYLYAASQAIEADFRRQNAPLEELDAVYEISPFLAWRASILDRAVSTEGSDAYDELLVWCALHRGQICPREETFADFVISRSRASHRHVDPLGLPPTDPGSFFFPGLIRDAIGRERRFDDALLELERDVNAGKFLDEPEILYGRLEELAGRDLLIDDAHLLSRIARRERYPGPLMDSVGRLLERCQIPSNKAEGVMLHLSSVGRNELGDDKGQTWGYSHVFQELQGIDWTDSERALARVDYLRKTHGTVAACVEISNALRSQGFEVEAAAYDARLERFVKSLWAWVRRADVGTTFFLALAPSLAGHPELARWMERELRKEEARIAAEGSEYVKYFADQECHRAHCLLTLGRTKDAAEAVRRSFEMDPLPKQYATFIYDGQVIEELPVFRRWLIEQLAADGSVTSEAADSLRELASADEAKRVEEARLAAEKEAAEKEAKRRAKEAAKAKPK